MKLASEKGLPPTRLVFCDFEDDPRTAAVEDEFLFGPDLLIAPTAAYQVRSREVYLPDGIEWVTLGPGRSWLVDSLSRPRPHLNTSPCMCVATMPSC